jgi:hypothetical protein
MYYVLCIIGDVLKTKRLEGMTAFKLRALPAEALAKAGYSVLK